MGSSKIMIVGWLLFFAAPLVANPLNILWDTSKGVYRQPTSDFQELIATLESGGHTLTISDTPLLELDLKQFDTLLVIQTTSWINRYSEEEADAVGAFVEEGGDLLLMSDNYVTPWDKIKPIMIRFGVKPYNPLTRDIIYFDRTDPMFTGIDLLHFRSGGSFRVEEPAVAVAWDTEDLPVMTKTTYGDGRALMFADSNWLTDKYLGWNDNRLMLAQTIKFLQSP